MPSGQKVKVDETLDNFLFRQIETDPEYIEWERTNEVPTVITDNLHPSKKLRDYQERAVKHFIWLYDRNRALAKHLMFNMATGTGKTLVMACCVLYLYSHGYRNFLFLVHRDKILKQAEEGFTNAKFEKYLFNPKGVRVNGRKVDVRAIERLADSSSRAINFLFFSTQTLLNRLTEDKENAVTLEDFEKNDIVIIADEAHSLNVDTRRQGKANNKQTAEQKDAENWENIVMKALNSREQNLLIEFTATVDLKNQSIHAKYEDKIVSRYDFLQFNKDGFSKDVKFLYNQETQVTDQKRLLIVNAVALSEYRRLFAEKTMNTIITPIVLVKSTKIAKSEEDREFFDAVIGSLKPEDLRFLAKNARANKHREFELLADMFKWIEKNLVSQGDWDGIGAFTTSIRNGFSHENTLIYNSSKKEKEELLLTLDNPRNTIRAIFSVNALNEGWDVLGLFDIVHFDIADTKKVSLQDIQLIGRGARYCPYELPKRYIRDESGKSDMFKRNLETDKYKRKFDNDPMDTGRILDTFVYHFVKTGTFLENLQKDLLGQGIINDGVESRTITMKPQFVESDSYKNGFVLVNRTIKRNKTTDSEIDRAFRKEIQARLYHLHSRALTDVEQNQAIAATRTREIQITDEYFARTIILKALMSAEGGFFRFANLIEHLPDITTVDELIEKYLPLYKIFYTYEEGKDIHQISAEEKLHLLVNVILPEVRKSIDIHMPRVKGSNKFRPVPLSQIFSRSKTTYLVSYPMRTGGQTIFVTPGERAVPQSNWEPKDGATDNLRFDIASADWYAYDENYGTSEEKRFVIFVASQIETLKAQYPNAEIYLIRNELDYALFSPRDGRRFCPDYLLVINDFNSKEMYFQCLAEMKGGHLLEHDGWKEEALIDLAESEVVFDVYENDKENYRKFVEEVRGRGYKIIKNIGFKFFNSDTRGVSDFAVDWEEKLL